MKHFTREIPAPSQNPATEKDYDVVVVGGGMSGLCAAIASARQGARTALIHDRGVYGGNASSEARMHISGASCHWAKKNASETGILMELMLENKYLNDSYNYSIWDGVLWSRAADCENLDCYMNCTMDRVQSDGKRVQSVQCYQMTTERRFAFTARIFIDCTGHGTLGYFAGAEYAIGREGQADHGETGAPPVRDGFTMGNTIYFVAERRPHPVRFIKPSWAHSFSEEDLQYRYHGDVIVHQDGMNIRYLKPDEDYLDHEDILVEKYDVQSGYWWVELGGDWDDIVAQAEDIRYELYRSVYGVWDHIKNGGEHGAENYELVWVGHVAGTRESRRLIGDYLLTEQDIWQKTDHPDSVAYGGWPMDEHNPGGLRAKGELPSRVRNFPGLYAIPYGCYCSKNIENLMMAGRNISATKLAMGSTRVMGTCAVGGEAAGTAAGMAALAGLSPRAFGQRHMERLQQELLKNDCYIPGLRNTDSADHARGAQVLASSEQPGFAAANVISGVARSTDSHSHLWRSQGLREGGETLTLRLAGPVPLRELRLTLDPNLSEERCISVSKAFIEKEPRGVAPELLRDYDLLLFCEGREVARVQARDNHQRLCVHRLDTPVRCDEVRLIALATNGAPDAHVFELRLY